MRLVFVHGWSVTSTATYGELPRVLAHAAAAHQLDLEIQHIFLGRYVSFKDEVTLGDIARGMERALRELPGNSDSKIMPFSCITHSTGGPVVRYWIDSYYGADGLQSLPLQHLVMLAPAHHGSSLATLGTARVGRIRAWFQGVEPGRRVLEWLCLGSYGQWSLNRNYLVYDYSDTGFYPFVLTGQGIDRKFYDFINSYLVENGSDGVVRVAGANMNFRYLSLVQSRRKIIRKRPRTYALLPEGDLQTAAHTPLGVYRDYSHSGTKMGIMRSITRDDSDVPVVSDILTCLQVNSRESFVARAKELEKLTGREQAGEDRYCMLVFTIRDDRGEQIGAGDYDLLFLAGKKYKPELLPNGFLEDKQMNDTSGSLVFYLNCTKMADVPDGQFGFRITARPSQGFAYYCAGAFYPDGRLARALLTPNQTTYIEIQLRRLVDTQVFRFDSAGRKAARFRKIRPSGEVVDDF